MGTTQNPIPPSTSMPVAGGTPPKQKDNIVAWILGGCATVIVLAMLALVLAVRLFVKSHVQVDSKGNVDIQMPGGNTMHAGAARDIGLPVYPGAETNSGRGVEVTVPGQKQNMSMATYMTSDPIEKVDAWYRENLGAEFGRVEPGQMHISAANRSSPIATNSISYIAVHGDEISEISLTKIMGRTQINLMRSGSRTGHPQ